MKNREQLDQQIKELFEYCKTIRKELQPTRIFENRFRSLLLIHCQENGLNFPLILQDYDQKFIKLFDRLKNNIQHEKQEYIDWLDKHKKEYKK